MAWSYSALTSFETCPHRHFKTRIEKSVQDPPGADAQWGTRVHKALEDRLNAGPAQPITGALAVYEKFAERLERIRGTATLTTERRIALTSDLNETSYFAKDVWLRVVVDVLIHHGNEATALDWKTGKRKPDTEQLELTAAALFALYPEVQAVKTAYIWLKEDAFDRVDFVRDDAPRIWSNFTPRVQRLEQAVATGEFPKKPSGLCRKWCPVKSCEFCGV
jgi:hypothetical protein